VNEETLVFGNQGGLFMNAMTWWDHKTESVWSQPWGRAIAGPLKGVELELLPNQLVPWGTWKEAHPNTLALKVDGARYRRESFRPEYVIGVALGESATAFPYNLAAQAGIINDDVGPYPVVVYVNPEAHSVHVYLRQVDERVLIFVQQGGLVQDEETGSTWQMDRGLAVDGALKGQALRSVPYIPAFPEAWRDFYPHSRWYEGS
jgi:hypothetical protein